MKKVFTIGIILLMSMAMIFAAGGKEVEIAADTVLGEKPANYPTKPIELVVPAAAGAAIDIPARALAEILRLGQPIVIVNRPGASQTIGTAEVAGRKADGYSLLIGANGNFLLQPHLIDLSYKTEDFRHLAMLHTPMEQSIVVTPSSPYKSFDQLRSALQSGKEISYSSANPGSVGHLAMVSVLQAMNVEAKFVPFNGSPEGIAALLGGHIDFYVIDSSEVVPRVKNGQFHPLLTIASERASLLPDVPSAKEVGYENMDFPGFKWIAIKKGTPEPIVQYLKKQIDEALMTDEYQSYLMKVFGVGVRVYTEEEMNDTLFSILEKSGDLIRSVGMGK